MSAPFNFFSPQKETPRLFLSPSKTNNFFFDENFKVEQLDLQDNFKFVLDNETQVIDTDNLEKQLNLLDDTTISDIHCSDNLVSDSTSLNLDFSGKGFFIPDIFKIRIFPFG